MLAEPFVPARPGQGDAVTDVSRPELAGNHIDSEDGALIEGSALTKGAGSKETTTTATPAPVVGPRTAGAPDLPVGPVGAVQGRTAVKSEVQEIVVPSALSSAAFVLDDDEDDQPLKIVLAKRRQHNAPVPASASASRSTKPKSNKPKASRKRRVEVADAAQRVAEVKVESSEPGFEQPASTAKAKPKGRAARKKAAPVSEVTVSVKVETSAAPSTDANTTTPGKKRAPRGKSAKARGENARKNTAGGILVAMEASVTVTARKVGSSKAMGKAKGKKAAVLPKEDAQANAKASAKATAEWSLDVRQSPEFVPVPPPVYHGPKHPPRTLVHPSAHLAALEDVKWDEAGFECMELSALPWIAGSGYAPLQVRFGKGEVLFEPGVPSYALAGKEGAGVHDEVEPGTQGQQRGGAVRS
ncbi:hypothetical protein C8Q76DRAFT_752823 [Earliella scabrosa]|nr:hypothetical protein C8Q76DRAFT_752823 [Earliella scabrosa]